MTTNRELNAMLLRLDRAAKATGVLEDSASLWLDHGSSTNGIAFRIWTLGSKIAANAYQPFGTFHFGLTKRDCEGRMHAMAVALETVVSCQNDRARANMSTSATTSKEPSHVNESNGG